MELRYKNLPTVFVSRENMSAWDFLCLQGDIMVMYEAAYSGDGDMQEGWKRLIAKTGWW